MKKHTLLFYLLITCLGAFGQSDSGYSKVNSYGNSFLRLKSTTVQHIPRKYAFTTDEVRDTTPQLFVKDTNLIVYAGGKYRVVSGGVVSGGGYNSNGTLPNAGARTGSDSDIVIKKDIALTTDNITNTGSSYFTTSQPYKSGSLIVKECGIQKDPSEYTEMSSTVFRLNYTPFAGNNFIIQYKKQ